MIRSFRHKGLRDLFLTGRSSGVRLDLRKRCLARLDALDADTELPRSTSRLPPASAEGRTGRALGVSGPWRITFEWSDTGDAQRVDLEPYH